MAKSNRSKEAESEAPPILASEGDSAVATDEIPTPPAPQPKTPPVPDNLMAARKELNGLTARYASAVEKGQKQIDAATKELGRVRDQVASELDSARAAMLAQRDIVMEIEASLERVTA